jgi:Mg2+ and Co2+ transporter CorA
MLPSQSNKNPRTSAASGYLPDSTDIERGEMPTNVEIQGRDSSRPFGFQNTDENQATAGALEDFLFNSLYPAEADDGNGNQNGGLGRQAASMRQASSAGNIDSGEELGSIFESSFDLTEDRLMKLFEIFDEDNSGNISYEELKVGLSQHGAELGSSQPLDDRSFLRLVQYLDADNSGEISFAEFSEGMRLLMLRSILKAASKSAKNKDTTLTEFIDYNRSGLKRSVLEGIGLVKSSRASFVELNVNSMSLMEFFLVQRKEEISVRWINITGKKASNIMKMMAVKYRLHPLALEDALNQTNQRSKADTYPYHYFIMVPVFYLKEAEKLTDTEVVDAQMKKMTKKASSSWRGCFDRKKLNIFADEEEVPKIGIHMTSIFITKPHGNTVITFNNERCDEDCWKSVRDDLKKSYSKLRQYDGQYLAYSLLDQTVDKIGPIIKTITAAIQKECKILQEKGYKELVSRQMKSIAFLMDGWMTYYILFLFLRIKPLLTSLFSSFIKGPNPPDEGRVKVNEPQDETFLKTFGSYY